MKSTLLEKFASSWRHESFAVCGLMSGTSCDGIDACVAEFSVKENNLELIRTEGFFSPYSEEIRQDILKFAAGKSDMEGLARADFAIGRILGRCALEAVEKSTIKNIVLVVSHGQTVAHFPDASLILGEKLGATLQIGSGAELARRTGLPVLTDLRSADIASGGQGAPLVPVADQFLYSSEYSGVASLNIGGIANITFIPARKSNGKIKAFDTGPGNMLSDRLIQLLTDGRMKRDEDGSMALKGSTDNVLLNKMMDHSFLKLKPPRSCGREQFGIDYSDEILRVAVKRNLSSEDIMATAAEFVARTIADSFKFAEYKIDKMWVSGGGIYNNAILKKLRVNLSEVEIRSSGDAGIDPDMKEALAFSLLGALFILGKAGNISEATGGQPSILGSLSLPASF